MGSCRIPRFVAICLFVQLSAGHFIAAGAQSKLFSDVTDAALGDSPFVHSGATVDTFPGAPLSQSPRHP